MKRLLSSVLLTLVLVLGFAQPVSVSAQQATPQFTFPEKRLVLSSNYKPRKHVVEIQFANLRDITQIDYVLTYQTNGVMQAVVGNLIVNQKKIDQTILLGTCSANSCVFDQNVTDLNLEVTTKYKSGKTVFKVYKVR